LQGCGEALYRNVAIDYHGSGMPVQPLDIEKVRHFNRFEQSLMRRGGLLFVANVVRGVMEKAKWTFSFYFALFYLSPNHVATF
jgi:hypothetical protein